MNAFKRTSQQPAAKQHVVEGWWDRPTVLLGATAFGFLMFQAIAGLKAYLEG